MAEIRILVDSYASSASVKETNANIEKMLVLLKQVDKYKDVLNKAVSLKDVLGATQKLAVLHAQMVKINQEEEKLAALKQKTSQETAKNTAIEEKNKQARIIGEEKYQQELNKTAKSEIELAEAKRKQAEAAKKAAEEIKKETGILGALKKQMNELNKQKLMAKTPEEIAKINGQLNTLKGNYKKLADSGKASTNTWANALSSFQFKFNFLGNLVAHGAMMIGQAITSSIYDSVDSFMEAEKNAKQLELALKNVGGEGSVALKTLLDQSNELQDKGIFSDDAIQQAQTQLANYGLTSSAIADLIPRITDMAAATGQDLASATDMAIKGINGQTKGLKLLGIDYKDTGDKAKNLSLLTDKLTKFQGANAAQLYTVAGQTERLKNKWDDLKETFGGLLVSSGAGLLDFLDVLSAKTTTLEQTLMKLKTSYAETATAETASAIKTIEAQNQTADARKKATDVYIQQLNIKLDAFKKERYASKELTDDQKKKAELEIESFQSVITQLENYKTSLDETSPFVKNFIGDQEDAAASVKDLSDELLAAQKQFYDDEFDLERYRIERRAAMREHDANQTIGDQSDLMMELLKIKEDEIDQLAALDKQKLHEEASYHIAEIQAENASAEQRALLIKEVEDKLQRDLEQIDRKAADDKMDAEVSSFDNLVQEIDAQNQALIDKAEEKRKKEKELEQERFEETQELRLAQLKKDSKEYIEAEQLNLTEQKDRALQLLEDQHNAGLLEEEDYQRKRKLIIEKYNNDVEDLNSKSSDDLIDDLKKISDEVENQLNDISDARQQHLKDDISAQDENIKQQQQLANAGLENTLAFEERRKAELEREQIREEERQRRLKKIESYWNLFTEYAKDDPNTAALKAAEQIAISEAIVAAFAEKGGMGEDLKETTTLINGEWDRTHASGDVLTMVSPKEGILTEKEVDALGGKKGFYDLKYSLQRMAENPLSDDLFGRQHDSFAAAAFVVNKVVDLSPMTEKLDNIERAINNKPVPSFSIDGMGHFIETIIKQNSRVTTDKGPITRRKKYID